MVDRSDKFFSEPSGWDVQTDWQVDDLESALTSADGGDLGPASLLCDEMAAEDRIGGVLSTRINTLLGLNGEGTLEFESPEERISEAAEEDWYVSAPEEELRLLMGRSLLLGVGFAQREVLTKNGRWIPAIRPWDSQFVSYSTWNEKWESYDAKGNQFQIDPVANPQWVMMHPYGRSRPWSRGIWRQCMLYWLAKRHAIKDWARYNSLHGSGMIVGSLPEGKSTDAVGAQKFWRDIKAIGRNARIVLPKGFGLEVLEAQARNWESFPKMIETANVGLSIVILGQPLTTEVANAIRTGSTAASAVRQDYLEFDAQWLSTWANESHWPAWAEWNFGRTDSAPWLKYHTEPPQDLKVLAETLTGLGGAIEKLEAVAPSGRSVDREALFRQFKVPLMEKK